MAIGGFNILGIAIVIVLVILFLGSLYFYSKFFKVISFKIRIVLKNTVTKGADFKGLYFPLKNESSQTQLYNHLEVVYRREVIKRKNFYFKNILILLLERFHRPFYWPFSHKVLDNLILLRPPTSFYYMTYLANLIFLWSLAILIVGSQSNSGVEVSVIQAVGWSILVALLGSLITFLVTYLSHRFYADEVKKVFFTELEEEQQRIFRTAFVGELINIKDDESDEQFNFGQSALTISESQTEMSALTRRFKEPETGWKLRDEDRNKYLTKKKMPKGGNSILQLHSKRLNLLDECRALKLINETSKIDRKAKKAKGDNF